MAGTPITSLPAASSIASTDSLLARVSSVTKTATVAVLAVALSALGLAHAEDYWPVSIDGPRTCSSGTTETALTGPACYSTLTFTTSGSSLSMAGSAGKVLVFVKGVLRYRSGFGSNAPDINTL